MTHSELYEIVKDHRDVWGEVLEYAETNSPNPPLWIMKSNEELFIDEADLEGEDWKRESVALDDRILDGGCPISTEGVIAAILGLGVDWLLDRTTEFHAEYKDGPRGFACTVLIGKHPRTYRTILAAVYAAIAEVKRGESAATN